MFFGQPFGAFGHPEYHISNLEIVPTASGAKVRIMASPNLGDAYYQVYVNNVFSGSVWCPEGVVSDWINVDVPTAGSASFVCFRVGANPDADNSEFARLQEEAPQQVTATWTWDYEVLGTADDELLTNWALTGVKKILTTDTDRRTRGTFPVNVSVSGGTATINVGTVAQGSGAVGSTVTLTAINNSGVSGTVDVDATTVSKSYTLYVRWPEEMKILRDTTNPPTTVIDTVKYNGEDTGSKVDEDVLAIGTYYYAFQGVSDTDDLGDKSTATTITVTGAPEAPTDLAYTSGNAGATVIEWTESTTVGATYNVYLQDIDDAYMDTLTPTQTLVTGSSSTTLPAITGYAGRAQVLVRAELAGVEEKNGDFLLLDYDSAGNYVSQRPNAPEIRSIAVSSGLDITVSAVYPTKDEKSTATGLELFVRDPDTVYDFTTADATGTLSAATTGLRTSTISYSFADIADGWHYVTAKAVNAGGVQSNGNAPEVAVYVSNENIQAPTGTFTLSRG